MKIRIVFKWIVFFVLGVILLTVGGAFAYEQISRIIAERNYLPEGKLVDVGGHNLHVYREGSSSLTVIFESGMDPFGHLSWFKVQETIAQSATTVSYDRAGILWSERGDRPKSSQSITDDLTKLLTKGDYPKPYIVVGHSLAGITLRRFIETHKDDIGGIVLVDVSHPDQAILRPPKIPPRMLMGLMSSFGLLRLTSARQMPNTEPTDLINLAAPSLIHKSVSGMFDEAAAVAQLSIEAREISSFGGIPLIVISATSFSGNGASSENESFQLRTKMQQDLLSLSTDSRQILAGKSTHYVQLEEPDIVIDAIESLIARVVEVLRGH
tara:strand:- start:13932 stop:14906 length:975 start_codon:yes stop_codon:yes gene_type:complete